MRQITAQRVFEAPPDVVWAVVSDPDVYAAVAPNLSSVEVLDGERERMVRECIDTDGNAWTESCHYWDDGTGFAVSVDVETSDFHRRLFDRFEGAWLLAEGDEGVRVTVTFDFDTRYGPVGWLVGTYLRYRAGPVLDAIFDGWAAEIEARRTGADRSTGERTPPRDRHTNRLYR